VREPGEFEGPLGHIRGARLIPLGELSERAGEARGAIVQIVAGVAVPEAARRKPP